MTEEEKRRMDYLISIGLIAKHLPLEDTHPETAFLIEDAQSPEIWDSDMDVDDANEVLSKFLLKK